jgi:hypothetical protein
MHLKLSCPCGHVRATFGRSFGPSSSRERHPIFRVERRGRSTERLRFKASIRLMTFWRDGADAATFIGILD